MTMKKQQNKSPYTYKTSNKKCTECGIVSLTVNKSLKYNKHLCIDCLCQLIIDSTKS
jgi:hypothetical protein